MDSCVEFESWHVMALKTKKWIAYLSNQPLEGIYDLNKMYCACAMRFPMPFHQTSKCSLDVTHQYLCSILISQMSIQYTSKHLVSVPLLFWRNAHVRHTFPLNIIRSKPQKSKFYHWRCSSHPLVECPTICNHISAIALLLKAHIDEIYLKTCPHREQQNNKMLQRWLVEMPVPQVYQ